MDPCDVSTGKQESSHGSRVENRMEDGTREVPYVRSVRFSIHQGFVYWDRDVHNKKTDMRE